MELGEYIAILENTPNKSRILKRGLGNPHSWRGCYYELSFEIVENISIEEMLDEAKSCLNRNFEGPKGGEYTMTETTPINIDNYGCYTDGTEMWSFLLDMLLS